MKRDNDTVTIRLTQEQASQLWLSIDGWLGAISCDADMSEAERETLDLVTAQIDRQRTGNP